MLLSQVLDTIRHARTIFAVRTVPACSLHYTSNTPAFALPLLSAVVFFGAFGGVALQAGLSPKALKKGLLCFGVAI